MAAQMRSISHSKQRITVNTYNSEQYFMDNSQQCFSVYAAVQQLDVSRVFSATSPVRTLPGHTFAVPATAGVSVRFDGAEYFGLAE